VALGVRRKVMPEHFAGPVDQQSLPSRLRISYKLEFASGTVELEPPFVIGVMADLSGYRRQNLLALRDRKYIRIDRENFDSVFSSIAPNLRFELGEEPGHGKERVAVDLCFKSLSDFEPQAVAEQIAPLREVVMARKRLSDLRHSALVATECFKPAEEARRIVAGLGTIAEGPDAGSQLDAWLDAHIAAVDRRLAGVLDRILHAPEFRRLESTWRGLDYLVSQTGPL